MKTVYVDTSALLPLLDQDDQDHPAVVKTLEHLAKDGVSLITTSYTLVETGVLVRNRLGVKAFRALGEIIDRSMKVIWIDEEIHRRAWEHAADEPRRGASLVDWAGSVVMRDFGISAAMALDKHFRRQGFTTLPSEADTAQQQDSQSSSG